MIAAPTHNSGTARAPASPEHQLGHLLERVGISRIEDIGWLKVAGDDRVRWLNGMVTNSIQQLQPGQGNYSFALNAQGQIQGDLTAFAFEDSLLLETSRQQVPAMKATFDRFIIMDDVELQNVSDERHGILVAGPLAQELLAKLGLYPTQPTSPESLAIAKIVWRGAIIEVVTAFSPLVPRFELWTDAASENALLGELLAAAETLGGCEVGPTTLEHLRILQGTPRYGTDILAKHLAQETAQTRALHFSKGCYLGQEIVERIRSRGNVHRTFAAFQLQGPLPAPGTTLTVEDKPVGELTSVAAIPLATAPLHLALGFIRREAVERPSPIAYIWQDIQGLAIPATAPIRPPSPPR